MPARFPNGLEVRSAVEVRVASGRRLEGYAAVFHEEARIADAFTETLLPGCFSRSLAAGGDVLALADHDPAKVLGRTRAGTLKLSQNGKGLWFELGELPATSAANDVLELVRSGNAGGCSFGFTVSADGERWTGTRRELVHVELRELSIVSAFPAYSGTSVAARARIVARLGNPAAAARHRARWLETL